MSTDAIEVRPPVRSDYHIVLELTALEPISHGAGNLGNEQQLRTREYLTIDRLAVDRARRAYEQAVVNGIPEPEARAALKKAERAAWRKMEVPVVSGAAVKATLREHAVARMCEMLGIMELQPDVHRLLAKGGKNDGGSVGISMTRQRELLDRYPVLAVFGSMDSGSPIPGLIICSGLTPWVDELDEQGLLPRVIRPLGVSMDGEIDEDDAAVIRPFADIPPAPMHLIEAVEDNFKHDSRVGGLRHLLPGAAHQQIAEKGDEVKGKRASKEERREANESMPYSAQVISPGTRFVCQIRLRNATDVEAGCLTQALRSLVGTGGHVGGRRRENFGAMHIRSAGGIQYRPGHGEIGTLPGGRPDDLALERAYIQHVLERGDDIRAEVAGG